MNIKLMDEYEYLIFNEYSGDPAQSLKEHQLLIL